MNQDKKTIAIEANPTTACVAFGLAMGTLPQFFQKMEAESDGMVSFPKEKQQEIFDVLHHAFRQANIVAGTREKILKDKKFMAEMEEMLGEIDWEEETEAV